MAAALCHAVPDGLSDAIVLANGMRCSSWVALTCLCHFPAVSRLRQRCLKLAHPASTAVAGGSGLAAVKRGTNRRMAATAAKSATRPVLSCMLCLALQCMLYVDPPCLAHLHVYKGVLLHLCPSRGANE